MEIQNDEVWVLARKIAVLGSVCIILFTSLYSIRLFDWFSPTQPKVQEGLMDLQDFPFERKGTIKLDGLWEFYPGVLIKPEGFLPSLQEDKKLLKVPGNWDKYITEEKPYGTYRVMIKVPKKGNFAIKVNMIGYASKVFINGKEIGKSGNPADNRKEYEFGNNTYTSFINAETEELELVIHASSFKVMTGGIVRSIQFGFADDLLAHRDRYKLFDSIIVAGYLLLAFLYSVTYFQQRKNIFELHFSIFCLLQGIYVSAINERVLLLIIPDINETVLLRMQLLLIHISLLFFLQFMCSFFKGYANKKVVTFLCGMLSLQAFILGPFQPFSFIGKIPLPLLQFFVVILLAVAYCYIIMILLRAFRSKMEGALYIINVVTSFACYGILLGVNLLFEVEYGAAPLFLFLVMVISLSFLISHRSHMAFRQVDELTKELLHFDAVKDEFLIKTSHELRTPLHIIINLSKSILEGISGPLKKEQQESLLLVHNVGKRMARIVENLLDAGSIKRGEVQNSPSPVSLQVVGEILEEMAYLLPNPQAVKLINRTDASLPKIFVDENILKQILFNLIYNSIKYTKDGEIAVTAEVINHEMSISVRDTGIGIDEENITRIFSAFYQVKENPSIKNEGLGLGLSITEELVEISGGSLTVSSTVGEGSCFTFTMPLAEEVEVEVEEEEEIERTGATFNNRELAATKAESLPSIKFPIVAEGNLDCTILVVDDEYPNVKILMDMISSLDYTVIAVDNGSSALEVIRNRKIDLVILDLMMPNMSGFEVCLSVREDYDLFDLPVIILTTAGQLSDLIYSLKIGANEFLQKPIIYEELKARVESLLLMKESSRKAMFNELMLFYSQIKPHFLFNTINTIIGLTYSNSEKTREALTHLSAYFRAKMDFKSYTALIPLEDEIELVQSYLEIERLRFGDKLKVIYDIDGQARALIPFLSLQPLLENAVQHGIGRDGGIVSLGIYKEGEFVKIMIEDNGKGIPKEKQAELLSGRNSRIGFINPFNKIKLINRASFSMKSEEGIGTKITIILPGVKE